MEITRRDFLRLSGLTVGAITISSCAGKIIVKDANLLSGQRDVDILIEPYESLFLKVTPEVQSRNITVVHGVFPEMLLGEYSPGRIRWNGWAILENGKEAFCQILFSGYNCKTEYYDSIVVIHASKEETQGAKVIMLSTVSNFGYDLGGNEFEINRNGLRKNYSYRKNLILEKGSQVDKRRKITNFYEAAIQNWNGYQTKDGQKGLSPVNEDDVKFIASINPQYSYYEKLIGDGNFLISLDPIATAAGIGIELIRAKTSVSSTGWDFNSKTTRRETGFIVAYLNELKRSKNKSIL